MSLLALTAWAGGAAACAFGRIPTVQNNYSTATKCPARTDRGDDNLKWL